MTLFTLVTRAFVCAVGFFILACTPGWAQEGEAGVPVAGRPMTVISTSELPMQEALKTIVSFNVRRYSLGRLFEELHRQSGVSLSLEESLAGKLVTARAHDMPLFEVMESLTRLYGANWAKYAENEYVFQESGRSELALQMLRLGNMNSLNSISYNKDARDRLAREVLAHTHRPTLLTQQGIAFTELPEELQQQVRQLMNDGAALSLIRDYGKYGNSLLDQGTMHVETSTVTARSVRPGEEAFAQNVPGRKNLFVISKPASVNVTILSAQGENIVRFLKPFTVRQGED